MSPWAPDELRWTAPDDFVRLDGVCAELLQSFCRWLPQPEAGGLDPERAGTLAHAADRYLRDFCVDLAEAGPANADPSLPRRYLANWYIVHTLHPSHAEIGTIREALELLSRYLAREGVIGEEAARAMAAALADEAYFHARLEAFWELGPEDIAAWRKIDDYREVLGTGASGGAGV